MSFEQTCVKHHSDMNPYLFLVVNFKVTITSWVSFFQLIITVTQKKKREMN